MPGTMALALGALAPTGDAEVEPETAVAAREIAWPLADGIAPALDDPDRPTRALALRVLAKLGDERLTPARLADALADGAPVLADAALSAARILVRDPSRPGGVDRRRGGPARLGRRRGGLLELPARSGAAPGPAGAARSAAARSRGQRPQCAGAGGGAGGRQPGPTGWPQTTARLTAGGSLSQARQPGPA